MGKAFRPGHKAQSGFRRMIEIKNLRKSTMQEYWDVRVDRKSVLGNPFYPKTELDRKVVMKKYKKYFDNQSKTNPVFKKELRRLYK